MADISHAYDRHEAHDIFDLSRTQADTIDHISFVLGPEGINNVYSSRTSKNGIMFSPKYHDGTKILKTLIRLKTP